MLFLLFQFATDFEYLGIFSKTIIFWQFATPTKNILEFWD